jgi:hypothetical protein
MLAALSLLTALGSCCSDDFTAVLVWSLAGIDLSLWALAKGLLPQSGDLLDARLLLG